jgi:Fur family transcriptional regulator, stress-responsive regulator
VAGVRRGLARRSTRVAAHVGRGCPCRDLDLIVLITGGAIVLSLLPALRLPATVRFARLPVADSVAASYPRRRVRDAARRARRAAGHQIPERPRWPRRGLRLDWFQSLGQSESVPKPTDFERMLREAGLRVTRPRLSVLSVVHTQPHADTDSILRMVRADLGDVSHQAVYDVLRALTAAGLVRRLQPMGSVARYEGRATDNHHHVVCRTCGAIADVDCAVGYAPCLTAADDAGYEIDQAEVIYWGRCPACLAWSAASSPD